MEKREELRGIGICYPKQRANTPGPLISRTAIKTELTRVEADKAVFPQGSLSK
jgi:hypothetical protein